MLVHLGRQFALSHHRGPTFSLWAIHRSVPSGVLETFDVGTWSRALEVVAEWVETHPEDCLCLPMCKEPE